LPVRFYWVRRARWLKLQEKKVAMTQEASRVNGEPIILTPVLAHD
jgi:hypothetical protein